MTAELVHVPRTATLPEKMAYAEALAFSGMLPEQYRKAPANVLWAVEYGETIGITAMAAITGVHMIEGKPTASAALISGLVRRAGHRLRSGYDAKTRTGWAEIVRFDDPEFTFRAEWDLARAVEAELCTIDRDGNPVAKDSKGRSKPWKKFYPSMTKARAITEVARDACEEVLFGLHYTPEELGAETDDEGNLLERRAERPRQQTADDPWYTTGPAAPDVPATATEDDGIEDAEVVGETPESAPPSPLMPLATKDQLTKIAILLAEKRGLSSNKADRDACVAACAKLVSRVGTLKSRSELTKSEASSVIEALNAETSLHPPLPAAAPVALDENPVRDILASGIRDANSPTTLNEAGGDIAMELARGNITPAEADVLREAWQARRAELASAVAA